MKVCWRVRRTSQSFTLYLRSPCVVVNKSMFSTRILLKYLPPVLAIISDICLKISNVFHYQCSFYEKFNKLFKNDAVIKMYGAQRFLLILFEWLY